MQPHGGNDGERTQPAAGHRPQRGHHHRADARPTYLMQSALSYGSAHTQHASPPRTGSLFDLLTEWRSSSHHHHHTNDIDAGSACSSPEDAHAAAAERSEDDDEMEDDDHVSNEARPARGRPRVAASTHRTSSPPTAAAAKTGSLKRSRYLRQADRHEIIRRLGNGERQVELAKEFGVTRAAVCHINKNRAKILAKPAPGGSGPFPSSASNPESNPRDATAPLHQTSSEPDDSLPSVYRVRSAALAIHLTALRSRETSSRAFRAMADRAFRVLLEEALAAAPTRAVEVATTTDVVCAGVVPAFPACAFVMGECGYPMLEAFRCLQPESPTGFITLEANAPREVVLRRVSAPLDVRHHNVFLLDATCASGTEAAVAIQSLVDLGVDETAIFFVTLVVSAAAAAEIADRFPCVHIVAAAVDADVTATGDACEPGVGHFQARYFNITTISRSAAGLNAEI